MLNELSWLYPSQAYVGNRQHSRFPVVSIELWVLKDLIGPNLVARDMLKSADTSSKRHGLGQGVLFDSTESNSCYSSNRAPV